MVVAPLARAKPVITVRRSTDGSRRRCFLDPVVGLRGGARMRTRQLSRGSNPFALTPSPHFAFPSSCYQAALDALQRGIDQHVGLMLLSGPAGCGKTMLLRAL